MKYESKDIENEAILEAMRAMAIAARTAPKARGVDELITLALSGAEKDALADKMQSIGDEKQLAFFSRDANNLRSVPVVLLIGVRNKTRGVPNCGNCGFIDCDENKKAKGVCALCVVDLGIALGSATSIAADHRIDTRVMFSIGKAALALGLMEDAHSVYGLPLSATGKSPFFDRKA
ncbi:DUF2148 domain-containing protein [Treponema sp.]